MLTHLAHLGYLLMLAAFVTRDMLRLRALLAAGQGIVIAYAWTHGLATIALWNALFVFINLLMAWQVLQERRGVRLPESLRQIHEQHFAALPAPEFLRWWQRGRRETVCDRQLTRQGEYPAALYFLLDGSARVSRGGETLVDLSAGYFVGEMSVLTGRPASADVVTVGEAELMGWSADLMREVREGQPAAWARLQSVLGYDLVEKIRVWELRARWGG